MKTIISLLVLVPAFLHAQYINNKISPGNKKVINKTILKERGHLYNYFIDRNGEFRVNDFDLLEGIDVIVEFKEAPLFTKMKENNLHKSSKADYELIFNQFKEDINKFSNALSKRTGSLIPQIILKKQFYKLFNGVNIDLPKGLLSSLYNLDYVKEVHKNLKIELIDERSIGGDFPVSRKSGISGDSVVIGIIDTGIDYMHPALGGGFGPGFKVTGGYDVIDEDDDPMDEIGHGTHVAGIAAANGDSFKGVAPDALLYAIKVFSNEKPTYEATVLEAIEKAMDPDNDGGYEDRVDVVNMSLGAAGNPNDPVSTAVNNASAVGTTFSISVGNSHDFYTISSPGNAYSAIGVGAKDAADLVANFSSKGPTKKTFAIKPDVIAPGTEIYSTFLNNGYEYYSGTSMAAPYIAGLCALIKSEHRDWTPAQIKSVIMNTAVLLNEDIMSQGSGLVDINKALICETIIIPSSLSFGYCNIDTETWTVYDTLIVNNVSVSQKNYSVNVSNQNNYVTVSPSQFFLAPGNSQKIIVKLSVYNSITPYVSNGSYSYSGIINIFSQNEILHVPWAFVKAPIMRLSFDKPSHGFLLAGKNNVFSDYTASWDESFTSAELILPNDTYDLLAVFSNNGSETAKGIYQIVVKENIVFYNSDDIFVSSAAAQNEIILEGVDESGKKLSALPGWFGNLSIVYPDSFMILSANFLSDSGNIFSISNVSERYRIISGEFVSDLSKEKKVYVVNYPTKKGIFSDLSLANKSVPYKKLRINTFHSPFRDFHNLIFGNTFRIITENSWGAGSFLNLNDTCSAINWNGTLYLSPEYNSKIGFTTSIFAMLFDENRNPDYEWFVTEPFRVNGDSIGCYSAPEPGKDVYFARDNGFMFFGNGFPSLSVNQYYYQNPSGYIYNLSLECKGGFGEYRGSDVASTLYSLYNSQNFLIAEGFYRDLNHEFLLNPGKYRLELKNNNYIVGNVKGEMTSENNFTVGPSYYYLPVLNSIQILNSAGMPVFNIGKKEHSHIRFSFNSYEAGRHTAKVYLKNYDSETWTELHTNEVKYLSTYFSGSYFYADMSEFTDYDSTALDMRLIIYDRDGNSNEMIWKPAVGIGEFGNNLLGTPVVTPPKVFKLYNNYPNPFNSFTTITYYVPVQSIVKIEVFNILGEKINTIFEGTVSEGNHKIAWDATAFASGIYFYQLTTEGKRHFQTTKKMIYLK